MTRTSTRSTQIPTSLSTLLLVVSIGFGFAAGFRLPEDLEGTV